MNTSAYFLLAFCAGAFLWNLTSGVSIVQELQKTSAAKSAFVMRYLPWRYLREYRKLTISQTGKTGSLYYHYTFSILAVLASALLLTLLLLS